MSGDDDDDDGDDGDDDDDDDGGDDDDDDATVQPCLLWLLTAWAWLQDQKRTLIANI